MALRAPHEDERKRDMTMKTTTWMAAALLAMTMGTGMAATGKSLSISYNLSGTLGPNLNGGPDCKAVNGTAITLAALTSYEQTPTSTTGNSATYTLPAGSVIGDFGPSMFYSTAPWTMTYTIGATNDYLTFAGPEPGGPNMLYRITLGKGSFTPAVFVHAVPLAPGHEPQNLTSPNTFLYYAMPGTGCTATKLGVTGTISSSSNASAAER